MLFEFLAREEEQLPYGCDAERSVVWQIQAQLEKSLVAPLEADYAERLAAARKRIESADGDELELGMPTLSEYANVHNTSLNILAEKGYQLWFEPGSQLYFAEKDGWDFASDSPGGLLGMVAIFEYQKPSKYEEYWWRRDDRQLYGELPTAPHPFVHVWDEA